MSRSDVAMNPFIFLLIYKRLKGLGQNRSALGALTIGGSFPFRSFYRSGPFTVLVVSDRYRSGPFTVPVILGLYRSDVRTGI